jgi:hypothetical protein
MNKSFFAALITAALLCATALAQSTTPSSQNPNTPSAQPEPQPAAPSPANPAPNSTVPSKAASSVKIAPGSVIPVELIKTVDAKKAKPGDPVVARVTMDMKTSSGEVLVPKNTKVLGHVTAAQPRNKEQKESQVGISFDRAELNGGEVSLPMSIQAVIAPPTNNANNAGSSDQSAPAGAGSPAPSPMAAGRSGSTPGAGQTQSSTNTSPNAVGNEGTNNSQDNSQQSNSRPQINGNTQGVIGISDLKLESAQTGAQGSVLTSDKNNVKVESGTFLLLKVNQ